MQILVVTERQEILSICDVSEVERTRPVGVLIADVHNMDAMSWLCEFRADRRLRGIPVAVMGPVPDLSATFLSRILRDIAIQPSPGYRGESRTFTVDQRAREIALEGKGMSCSPLEFRLFLFFLRHPGIVFAREELVRRTRGTDNPIDMRIIDVMVHRIRNKIERKEAPLNLRSVHGLGYIFHAERDLFIDALTGQPFLSWPCCP